MGLWEVINSNIIIFALGSIGVFAVTRYLDSRNARRVEAQKSLPYIIECVNRIGHTLSRWPGSDRLLLSEYWDINSALEGRVEPISCHSSRTSWDNRSRVCLPTWRYPTRSCSNSLRRGT